MMAVKEEVLDTSFEEDPESDILAMALGHPLPTKKINRKHVNDHYYSLFPGDQDEEDIKFSDTVSLISSSRIRLLSTFRVMTMAYSSHFF
ncbi:unnamed protein product [Nippostrongylus brasiliensis]|uniref:KRAP_IP3R_bind domain-containing protein n=1 Tax=Nippostrongylus brasiliensis TaxID=27835 RepID=A0A0N4YNW2_NIPBR|nr:unnamed protein product [Nippostrongylus brasiliensis]